MRHRFFLLLAGAGLFGAGVLGVACSPKTTGFPGDDAGNGDATTDTGKTDGGGGNDSGGGNDGGGTDGSSGPCTTTNIKGECDIVKQDCTGGKECLVAQDDAGTFVTVCGPASTGSIPKGGACTPSQNNPCVKGLECVSGRCGARCCYGDDTPCGNSVPEGYSGACDINVVDSNNNPMYAVCTYSASCKPFGIKGCPSDYTCLVQDSAGTAKCVNIFQPPGKDEGQACGSANDCKDGMMCVGALDGGADNCQWTCYSGGGPYDAGIQQNGAGKGGCPSQETCKSINWQGGTLPTWLGLCGK